MFVPAASGGVVEWAQRKSLHTWSDNFFWLASRALSRWLPLAMLSLWCARNSVEKWIWVDWPAWQARTGLFIEAEKEDAGNRNPSLNLPQSPISFYFWAEARESSGRWMADSKSITYLGAEDGASRFTKEWKTREKHHNIHKIGVYWDTFLESESSYIWSYPPTDLFLVSSAAVMPFRTAFVTLQTKLKRASVEMPLSNCFSPQRQLETKHENSCQFSLKGWLGRSLRLHSGSSWIIAAIQCLQLPPYATKLEPHWKLPRVEAPWVSLFSPLWVGPYNTWDFGRPRDRASSSDWWQRPVKSLETSTDREMHVFAMIKLRTLAWMVQKVAYGNNSIGPIPSMSQVYGSKQARAKGWNSQRPVCTPAKSWQ